MASISQDKRGNWIIQFVAADQRRRTIRLAGMTKRTAEEVRRRVDALNVAKICNTPPDRDTAEWLSGVTIELARKLAAAGLTGPVRMPGTLDSFIASYIA